MNKVQIRIRPDSGVVMPASAKFLAKHYHDLAQYGWLVYLVSRKTAKKLIALHEGAQIVYCPTTLD